MITIYRFNIGDQCNYCEQKEILIAYKSTVNFC